MVPDSHFEPRRYRVKCRCERCGHIYHSPWAKSPPTKDPPCPKRACRDAMVREATIREAEQMRRMLEEGVAPAHVGANVRVKAVDETAKVVMEDFHMTDLKDNIREGESMAPKLPPAMQAAADNYFGGGGLNQRVQPIGEAKQPAIPRERLNRLGRMAISGAFRGMAVGPNSVTPAIAQGSPALTVVRREGK